MNVRRPEILILDIEHMLCSDGQCGRLPSLLQKIVPTAKTYQKQNLSEVGAENFNQLDLILLRTSSPSKLPELINTLRTQGLECSLMGVFCFNNQGKDTYERDWVNGLNDFISCPYHKIDLAMRVNRLLQIQNKASKAMQTPHPSIESRVEGLVGQSKIFLQAIRKISPIAKSEETVLLTGETGTGKELFARAIHYHGPRKAGPFIPINCGALPDQLFENELFGHTKGAYTDADSSEKGLVTEAEGGTLFLDEVDTLSLSAQAKLLRLLQGREYRPIGSSKCMIANVRIVAATNCDLKGLVKKRHFREDLYYRLNILPLKICALKDRIEDIPALVNHFLVRNGTQAGRGGISISSNALQKLMAYSWPGNVRELEAMIKRAVILCPSNILREEDFEIPANNLIEKNSDGSLRRVKAEAVRQFEQSYLITLLREYKGNVTHAAKAAGKERRTFQRLLRKHGVEREAFCNPF